MKPLLVLPGYSEDEPGWRTARMIREAEERNKSLDVLKVSSSFLTWNFNNLWCYALNHDEYSHFIMLHSDIVPKEKHWLDKMLMVTNDTGADVMSVVVPLKLTFGLTSTALSRGEEFGNFRRLTMTEVMELPENFSKGKVADLFGWERSESTLLTNTGLMVVNLKKRDKLAKMCFTVNNWIRKDRDGLFYPVSEPEDWNWAKQAQGLGLQVWATRAVPVEHLGVQGYSNDYSWGTIEHDAGDRNAA